MNIIVKTTLEQAIEDLKMIANPDIKNFELNQLLSDDINIVLKEIERLNKGYCELKEKCNNGECDCKNEEYYYMCEHNMKLSLEVDRLNNIINELEKWLKDYIKLFDKPDMLEEQTLEDLKEVLDKLQELKGCDK